MTTPTTVLVLDGEQRAALAVVRSLGRQGLRVVVGSPERRSLSGGSRFTRDVVVLPDPLAGSAPYSAAVARAARDYGAAVVLPVTEASCLALLEGGDLPEGTRLPMAGLDRFRRACDKEAVLSLANDLGLAVPAQWSISGAAGSEAVVPEANFPVVIKPARSVAGAEGHRRKVGVRYASDPRQLRLLLDEIGEDAGPFLIQTRIRGQGLGVFLLRWDGRVHASFAHRRIREKPPSGGVSVCSVSLPLEPALLAQSEALLEALDWEGVAMVEFKHDDRTGRDYLMEVNPRFWGSLQLAIDAGVDFPRYLVQLALGEQVRPVHAWQTGVRLRWCLGEIDHLIARLRRSRAELDLPDDAPGLVRTAAMTLLPWRPGQRGDVFRFHDPIPAVRELVAWLGAV